MKVLFCANIPSPYRVAFFNELGKLCDLTVCYERKTAADRDAKWVGAQAQTYKEVYLDLTPLGTDKSWGNALRKFIASNTFDRLIMTNYVSPACMEAITYCKLKHIPYWVEYDGGFNKQDSLPKRLLKKYLVGGAVGHLTTCDEHIEYLKRLGIPTERIYKYPFTSLSESDLKLSLAVPPEEKSNAKAELGVSEEYMLLSVGRFSYEGGYGKGYDTLMEAAKSLSPSIGIYIVGDEPTQEFIEWKERESLSHVHFVGFKQKQDLALYYTAADAFILLSRGDIWGLVINEAMSFSLPVITTRQCLAGTELVQEGVNGYLIEAGDAENAVARINEIFACPEIPIRMGQESGRIIREYSIEKMAVTHSLHLRGECYHR